MHEDLLTCLNKERLNEPKKVLKYSEGITDDVAIINSTENKNMDDSIIKQVKDKSDDNDKKIVIFGAILLGLVTILAIVFFIVPMLTEVPEVKIPDVSGWTVVEAETELEKLKLEVNETVEEESSTEVEKGKVIRTNPSTGRTVKEGTSIILVVSTGELVYLVEDLTGKNYIEVKTELEKLYNLTVIVEEKEVENTDSKTYKEQEIVGQSVDSGKELTAGDEITIYIPKVLEKYPDLQKKGWSEDEIKSWAEKKGLVLTIEYKETNEVAAGTIISQSRGTDSYITSGATLKVVIAKAVPVSEETSDGTNTTGE